MEKLRKLTQAGVAEMHRWLDQIADENGGAVPDRLLADTALVQPYPGALSVEQRPFRSRLEWGIYIDTILRDIPTGSLQADAGLWAWLTLLYFDQVCPADTAGRRKVAQRARYIPVGSDYRTYYRHLLQGPWRLIRAHQDAPRRTSALLAGPLHRPGDLYEQLASRQELATSPSVVALATQLYIEPGSEKLKRGAGGSGGGSPRRLAEVLLQFDLTYDIYAMAPELLMSLLPKEFGRFTRKPNQPLRP